MMRRSHISGCVLRMSSMRARSLAAWPSHLVVVIVDGVEEEEEAEDEEEEDPALRLRPPPVTRLRLPPPRELICMWCVRPLPACRALLTSL